MRKDEANREKKLMFLIESLAGEDDATFAAAVEEMIRQSYGLRPEWLEFQVGGRWERGGQAFREFRCAAGSVSLFLMREAASAHGFERRIIYTADVDDGTQAYEIARGIETDFPSKELTET